MNVLLKSKISFNMMLVFLLHHTTVKLEHCCSFLLHPSCPFSFSVHLNMFKANLNIYFEITLIEENPKTSFTVHSMVFTCFIKYVLMV